MFLELIAVIFAGFAIAGIVMLLNRATGGRLPRWLAPVAAGFGMIAVTIGSEYGWYSRTAAALPEGLEIAEVIENQSLYRPWTFVVPYVDRFAAVDRAAALSHPDQAGLHIADVYFFGRWAPVNKISTALNCTTWARAVLSPGSSFASDGSLPNLNWITPPSDDALLATFCGVS